jgi:hypothetical protein
MINRSECTCACHTNAGVMHVTACCRPDPTPSSIVRVKPLQWNGIEALSPAGSYRVQRLDDKWEPLHNGSFMLPKQFGVVAAFDTVDDAKSACQADYETRILAALSATATEGE